MSHNNKKSIFVLGNGETLKKALIINILGKGPSQVQIKPGQGNTVIYENEDLEITLTPELNTSHEDIKNLFAQSPLRPDLCLLVVQEDFKIQQVWEQIKKLSKMNGKPPEDFEVQLFCSKYSYLCTLSTVEQTLRRLRKEKTEDKVEIVTDERFPESNPSTGKLPGTTVNLVLLGLTGAGKSSSANTILGRNHFKSEASPNPTTTDCQLVETQMGGRCVRVIDTPDIFDDDLDKSVKNKHVAMCKQLCQSEPCVYLLVLEVGRFTDGERNILTKAEETFGSEARNQTIILFTRGDDLRHRNKSKEAFINNCQADLKTLINQCGGRVVVFDNKDPNLNPHQVEELMQTVEKTLTGHRNY